MTRPTVDEYFLALAATAATRSDCHRAKVGAVVVGADGRTRSTGYNGSAAGQPGCETCPRRMSGVAPDSSYDSGKGTCVAIHAEMNAILYCDRADLDGATLYVTRAPCPGCARMISATKVARVVYPNQENTVED